MTNALIPSDFESTWLAERGDLLARAATVTTVNDDYSLEVVGEVQTAISKAVKKLEAERKSVTAPLDDAKKQIMAQEKKLAAPLNAELARLKSLTSAYATECARRIEEERRRREEEERRAAEAAVAAEDADPFGFNASPDGQAVLAQPAPMPPPTMPKTSANRMVEKWDFAVTDANAVPRELCSPDERKIRAFLAAKKAEGYKADQIVIDGIRISAVVQVQSR
jgi:hypothetical protein